MIQIAMTPLSFPMTIPTSGGSFDYNIEVANLEATTLSGQVWCDVILPSGSTYGPTLGPASVVMPAGFVGDRDRIQDVPGVAPAGTYIYNGYVGNYPGSIWTQDSFTFEKLTIGEGPCIEGWTNTGEPFEDWLISIHEEAVPDVFALGQNYPNPFNPMTMVSFSLPENARIHLVVYDLLGRQVATLINGWRDAGVHEVVFDAADLASGIYLYHLEAKDFASTGKMVLMK